MPATRKAAFVLTGVPLFGVAGSFVAGTAGRQLGEIAAVVGLAVGGLAAKRTRRS